MAQPYTWSDLEKDIGDTPYLENLEKLFGYLTRKRDEHARFKAAVIAGRFEGTPAEAFLMKTSLENQIRWAENKLRSSESVLTKKIIRSSPSKK